MEERGGDAGVDAGDAGSCEHPPLSTPPTPAGAARAAAGASRPSTSSGPPATTRRVGAARRARPAGSAHPGGRRATRPARPQADVAVRTAKNEWEALAGAIDERERRAQMRFAAREAASHRHRIENQRATAARRGSRMRKAGDGRGGAGGGGPAEPQEERAAAQRALLVERLGATAADIGTAAAFAVLDRLARSSGSEDEERGARRGGGRDDVTRRSRREPEEWIDWFRSREGLTTIDSVEGGLGITSRSELDASAFLGLPSSSASGGAGGMLGTVVGGDDAAALVATAVGSPPEAAAIADDPAASAEETEPPPIDDGGEERPLPARGVADRYRDDAGGGRDRRGGSDGGGGGSESSAGPPPPGSDDESWDSGPARGSGNPLVGRAVALALASMSRALRGSGGGGGGADDDETEDPSSSDGDGDDDEGGAWSSVTWRRRGVGDRSGPVPPQPPGIHSSDGDEDCGGGAPPGAYGAALHWDAGADAASLTWLPKVEDGYGGDRGDGDGDGASGSCSSYGTGTFEDVDEADDLDGESSLMSLPSDYSFEAYDWNEAEEGLGSPGTLGGGQAVVSHGEVHGLGVS